MSQGSKNSAGRSSDAEEAESMVLFPRQGNLITTHLNIVDILYYSVDIDLVHIHFRPSAMGDGSVVNMSAYCSTLDVGLALSTSGHDVTPFTRLLLKKNQTIKSQFNKPKPNAV